MNLCCFARLNIPFCISAVYSEEFKIPSNANIMYELEIIKLGDGPIDLEDTTAADRIELATKKKV